MILIEVRGGGVKGVGVEGGMGGGGETTRAKPGTLSLSPIQRKYSDIELCLVKS